MADYWKSNPRKFCEFCQCWFADNKSSKEFHERGKRHKENVEKKIGELRKKGQKQYETQQQLSGFLKEMEEGAMKAFKKDVAANPNLIPEYKVALVENSVRQQQENSTALSGGRYQPSQSSAAGASGIQATASTPVSATPSSQGQAEWVAAVSPEGHTYYWNTKTGATQWEKPANFIAPSSSSSQESSSSNKQAEETNSSDDSDEDDKKTTQDNEEKYSSRGTKRKSDAYGGWTSISTEFEETPDLQLPEANPLYVSSYVPQVAQFEPREELEIQEKVVGSIKASSREAPGGASFKKRKGGGQRQIRSRDSTS